MKLWMFVFFRLREEWIVRLENRNKNLKKLNENFVNKAKAEKSADQK